MKSTVNKSFIKHFNLLPLKIQNQAKQVYRGWKEDPFARQYGFEQKKRTRNVWSVDIGRRYRALGRMVASNQVEWFWIGSHETYNQLLKQVRK